MLSLDSLSSDFNLRPKVAKNGESTKIIAENYYLCAYNFG